ncbi:MAG TPA: PEGA domain-containing protein [Candidatus Paceibacterota bacterium]|nr:PEGA domain-containing protein [Candidatus Paceibacterota bacterium]
MTERAVVRAAIVATAAIATLLAGCASIIHGTSQDVGISSSPTGAAVWIDNAEKGRTPLIAKLARRDNHVIKIQMDGYQPFEATVTHSVSGWVWGNIVFGGLVGLAVDAISGGLYKLTPEQVSGTLAKQNVMIEQKGDGIFVVAVLKPQADWVKVAQLKREALGPRSL